MRWRAKQFGDFKLVSRFALLPKKIGQDVVWLEKYWVIYEWVSYGYWYPKFETIDKSKITNEKLLAEKYLKVEDIGR